MTKDKWSPSAKYCASILHMVASIAIMQAASLQEYSLLWVSLGLAAITAVKEFWADLTWLEHDSLTGSALDFFMYMLGLGCFLASLLWFWVGVLLVVVIIGVAVFIDMENQDVFGP